MADSWNAFIDKSVIIEPTAQGSLTGKSFCVKDAIDIEGTVTGAGHPDWASTHGPALANAVCVQRLLDAGARLVGKTHTDELMYSLNGENAHYGTPINPAAPDRVPGGSSSGSVVAVASGQTDFGLGTDTGGSIRIPASYCGIYGLRPTHGRISSEGVVPLAPRFDTVGIFARDVELLRQVAAVLLEGTASGPLRRALIPTDMLNLVEDETRVAFQQWLAGVGHHLTDMEELTLAPNGLKLWMDAFRTLQGQQVWQSFGWWIEQVKPTFGPGIGERIAWTKTLGTSDAEWAEHVRVEAVQRISNLLGQDGFIVLPTAPGPAPKRGLSAAELELRRYQIQSLTCVAGLGGLPQVTLPLLMVEGLPVGVSLLGPTGSDEALLLLASALKDQTDML